MWPLRNALDLKPIYACLEDGADFERHVLPAVEAESKCAFDGGRKIGSWARFQTATMAAVERDRLIASKSQAPGLSPEDRERAHRITLKRYVAFYSTGRPCALRRAWRSWRRRARPRHAGHLSRFPGM